MAKKKPISQRPQPPVPFSDDYIWVQTKESSYWRRKRGTLKPAKLNDAFRENVQLTKMVAPAAKRMVAKLQPWLSGLETGRIVLRFSHFLRKPLKTRGRADFSLFGSYEFQERFPLRQLLVPLQTEVKKDEVKITIPINHRTLKKLSNVVTDYFFELILMHGDPMKERGLKIESVTSALYPFMPGDEWKKEVKCKLNVELPANKNPWMVMLKLSSQEGNEMAVHPRHYRMKVLAVGERT